MKNASDFPDSNVYIIEGTEEEEKRDEKTDTDSDDNAAELFGSPH